MNFIKMDFIGKERDDEGYAGDQAMPETKPETG